MITKKQNRKKGFTLIELGVVTLLSAIVIFGIMVIIVDSHRGWRKMYDRVNGRLFSDAISSRRAFETVARKASMKQPSDSETDLDTLTLHYFSDPTTAVFYDRYATFYFDTGSDELNIEYGNLDADGNKSATSTMMLAENVDTANSSFAVASLSVRMILVLDNGERSVTVTSSAYRHNP